MRSCARSSGPHLSERGLRCGGRGRVVVREAVVCALRVERLRRARSGIKLLLFF